MSLDANQPALSAAAGFALRALALTVQDAAGPQFAVGGTRSPAAGVVDLDVRADDAGLGLRSAAASIDGEQVSLAGFGGCDELSPADATVDIARGADCVHVGTAGLVVDTTTVADGTHTFAVTVTDIAGNAVTQSSQVEVLNHSVTPTIGPGVLIGPSPTVPGAHPRLTTAALVRLPKRVSRTGVYAVSVLCPASAQLTCAHRLTLKAKGKTIAAGRGTSKPGKRARIALQLTAAARRTLRRQGALTATLTLSGAAPTTVRLRA